MKIRTAAELMGASVNRLRPELFDKEIADFSIDSRTSEPGELFFALSQPDYERAGFNGEFADAHNFIAQAFTCGAIASVARRERLRGSGLGSVKRSIASGRRRDRGVANTRAKSLEQWAVRYRDYRQRRQNDDEGIDGTRASEDRSPYFEE